MKQNTLLLLALCAACDGTEGYSRPTVLSLAERTDETVENLQRAGYPAHEIEVRESGEVLVGLDAEVSLEASREMIGIADRRGELRDESDEGFRQYRTANLVSSSIAKICINGSAYGGTLGAALDAAIANYNDLDLTFELVRTSGSSSGCDAMINAKVVSGGGGLAGFPSGGMPYHTINIGDAVAGYGKSVATHVIEHELGHCIGFRHTDFFDRSISCGTGGNEGTTDVGAIHIPGTPSGAVVNGSVMNSCFNGGSTGQWTNDDVTALLALYEAKGAPPPPAPPASSSCEGRCDNYDPAQSCQCDAACSQQSDCCSDRAALCDAAPPPPPPAPAPAPNSCYQACGGNAGQCWCDNLCSNYGDCCEDLAEHC